MNDHYEDSPLSDDPNTAGRPRSGWRFWLPPALIVAAIAFVWGVSQFGDNPPPPQIARDPLLVQGRKVYLNRCLSCHGETGAGNGPISATLTPPPGNFLAQSWKHGKTPETILGLVRKGAPNSAMPAFQGLENEEAIHAVAAYVLHLANEPIPEDWRKRPKD